MSTNETVVDATTEQVFDVLRTARHYPEWVVGAKAFRGADPGFPAPGTKFHHSVGAGPVTIKDNTEVLELDPGRRIVLQARTRPLGTARVEITVLPAGHGARIVMKEGPGDHLSRLFFNTVADLLLKGRNVEALRRLKDIVETQARSPGGSPS